MASGWTANYAFVDKQVEAIRQLETAVTLRPNDANILYNAACTSAVMNRKREALDVLWKTCAAGDTNWHWIARAPDLACLHEEPEFQRLLEEGKQKGRPLLPKPAAPHRVTLRVRRRDG